MSVPAAYLGVILIWTTTPLAIQWSTQGPGFLFGVTGRMVIGLSLALVAVRLMGKRMPWHRRARKTYLVAGAGIFSAMGITYWSAQFIPSGWISVLFGLSPIVTGVLASKWLDERSLTPWKLAGMLLGLVGLAVVFSLGAELNPGAVWGIGGILAAVMFHSASAVGVKRVNAQLPGLVVTAGGLLVSVPLFLLTWFLTGSVWPEHIGWRAAASITYLGVIGSVLGFALYFFVLRRLDATRVALITLVTPVTALLLGHYFNQEPITGTTWIGTGCIILGLVCFEFGGRWRPVPVGNA